MLARGCALVLVACACSHAPPPAPHAGAKGANVTQAPVPEGPDLDRELMGFVVLARGAELAHQLLPETSEGPSDAQSRVLALFGVDPGLAGVLDLGRPAGLAMLNPSLLASTTVRPYVAMLPIKSRRALEQALTERGATLERMPWGFLVPTNLGTLFVGCVDEPTGTLAGAWALVAWRADLLDGTRRLLAPEMARKAEAPLRVRVRIDNVHSSFSSQVEALFGNFAKLAARTAEARDPQLEFNLRGLTRLSRYIGSIDAIEILGDLDSGGATVTARLVGKPKGEFAAYVREQRPGPAWGLQYLPRDAVMVYATRSNARSREDDVAASMRYLLDRRGEAAAADAGEGARRALLQQALTRAGAQAEGELAWAVWPGHAGGLGAGGAYRVSDGPRARTAVRAAYGELAGSLGQMVARALLLDPERWGSRVNMKQSLAKVAGVEVDLVEIALKWPHDAQAERRTFESLFGPRLTLATAFVDDQALFTLGADWETRLGTMIGAARGQTAASIADEPGFAEALGFHATGRVSMSYLDADRMARFAARLIAEVNELDPHQRAAVGTLLGQVGAGAIVSTTNATDGRLELTTRVPRSMLAAARLSGAVWRVALSPLVSPPLIPPMPLPPPNVTPSLHPFH